MSAAASPRRRRARWPSDPTLPVADRARARVRRARRLRGAALDGAARARRSRTARCTRSARASLAMLGMLAAARLPTRRARGRPRPPASLVGRARARAARRRRRRRAAAARPLGRAERPASAAASSRCPACACPYRGVDEWTRTVIPLGGTVLVDGRRPRSRSGRARGRIGFPVAALGLLVALYAIPAVALDFENEFLRGAALALLVLAFLRLEKLRVGDAGNAGLVAAGVAVLALMLAPALDARPAVVGLRELGARAPRRRGRPRSRGTTTTARSTGRATAASCCACGPSSAPAYWKAENLDGVRRRPLAPRRDADFEDPSHARRRRGDRAPARSEIRVTIRNLSQPRRSSPPATPTSRLADAARDRRAATAPGSPAATLRRGDAYTATVYTPQTERGAAPRRRRRRPTAPTSRASGALLLPGSRHRDRPDRRAADRVRVPAVRRHRSSRSQARTEGNPQAIARPRRACARCGNGPYRRSLGARAAAGRRRPRRRRTTSRPCCRYLRRRLHLQRDAAALGRATLDGFLFDAKSGYCQQFSGAMALLLRMGGVPARVVDRLHLRLARRQDARVRRPRPRRPLVGRGLVPRHRLGHVRPDAGRRAAALAAQRGRRRAAPTGRQRRAAEPRRRPRRPTRAAARPRSTAGTPWGWYALGGVAAPRWLVAALCSGAGAAAARHAARRRSCSPSSSARCAAPAATPAPGTTLQRARAALRPQPRGRRLRARACASCATAAAAARRRAPSAAACAPSWPAAAACAAGCARGGRCRRAPRRDLGAYDSMVSAMSTTSTTCSSAARSCSRQGTSTRRPCRWRRPRDLEPEKTSIREALGRAYFRSRQFEQARVEFEAVVERAPTNDYALFCLGRALLELGPPGGGAQAARAGRSAAPRPARLPHLPRRGAARRTRPLSRRPLPSGAITRTQLFRGRMAKESGRSPAFFMRWGEVT